MRIMIGDTLNAGLKLVVATMTNGGIVKWLIVGILGLFLAW